MRFSYTEVLFNFFPNEEAKEKEAKDEGEVQIRRPLMTVT
jgi:hypothetical protein